MEKTNETILIVEDDPFLNSTIGHYLKEEGFIIDTVDEGETAFQKIKENDYKIILLDLIIPKKNGFEILKDLKKIGRLKTPIIVFSNLSQVEDEKEALELGASAYYVKHNVSLKELIKIIKKFTN